MFHVWIYALEEKKLSHVSVSIRTEYPYLTLEGDVTSSVASEVTGWSRPSIKNPSTETFQYQVDLL